MSKEQLNSEVLKYQESRSESAFMMVYDYFITRNDRKFKTIGKSIGADYYEARAIYEDTLLSCIESYNGEHDFERLFNASVPLQRRYFLRGRVNRNKREIIPKGDHKDAATFEVPCTITPEELLTTKKEVDQRQLIDFLLGTTSDATTIQIAEAYLSSEKPTPTAIGKKLGLHHSTVIRKLEKLSRNFDTKQFGDYRDYLIAQ